MRLEKTGRFSGLTVDLGGRAGTGLRPRRDLGSARLGVARHKDRRNAVGDTPVMFWKARVK